MSAYTLEYALLRWHGRDFWQRREPGQSWEDYAMKLVKIYDEVGMWHVLPDSVLPQRKAWRDGTAKARYHWDEAAGKFKDA
jgi:hypothetical protein